MKNSLKKFIFITIIFIGFSECGATENKSDIDWPSIQLKTNKNLAACMNKATLAYDDNISTAKDIGSIVVIKCLEEFKLAEWGYAKGDEEVMSRIISAREGMATDHVLEIRRIIRANKDKLAPAK